VVWCGVVWRAYATQVGDGPVEHTYWGPPETESTARPSYKVSTSSPGTEPVAEAAAAMAAGYLVFKDHGQSQ
jgi:endoglucanase